ncbi:MAG: hypothetical protein LQ344_005472 [Seirophora lacunosa]|nr:MAG: hypothetical protein LQ344_005472 [Seirophora lacunosa]
MHGNSRAGQQQSRLLHCDMWTGAIRVCMTSPTPLRSTPWSVSLSHSNCCCSSKQYIPRPSISRKSGPEAIAEEWSRGHQFPGAIRVCMTSPTPLRLQAKTLTAPKENPDGMAERKEKESRLWNQSYRV